MAHGISQLIGNKGLGFVIPAADTPPPLPGGSTPQVLRYVRNDSGAIILKGTPVYLLDAHGPTAAATIRLARADDDATADVFGLTNEDIANGANGYVCVQGVVTGLDTTPYNLGQTLYLSDTVAGGMTATNAQAIRYGVRCAKVVFRNMSAGILEVLAGKEATRTVTDQVEDDISKPVRALDTNYTPSLTRDTWVIATVRISASVTVPPLTGTATTGGRIELRSDNAATPSRRIGQARTQNSATHTLLVSLGLTLGDEQDVVLIHYVPKGQKYRLPSIAENGAPVFTLVDLVEVRT